MNILITGTSSGIGFGLALHYLNEGNEVYGISRKINDKLNSFARFHFTSLDLSYFEIIDKSLHELLAQIKTLDLVVLNAGILPVIGDMKDTSLDSIKKVMDINVWANKVLLDSLFNMLQVHQVVAISSGAAKSGSRGWNAYSLSKATLNMLINLYSNEQEKTHFTALAPGIIDTNMQDYIYDLPDDPNFPVIQKLKKAKGTTQMPDPVKAAPMLAEAIAKANKYPSGEFMDVREME